MGITRVRAVERRKKKEIGNVLKLMILPLTLLVGGKPKKRRKRKWTR